MGLSDFDNDAQPTVVRYIHGYSGSMKLYPWLNNGQMMGKHYRMMVEEIHHGV